MRGWVGKARFPPMRFLSTFSAFLSINPWMTVMYAIIADGGRQYKVEEGQQLEVDLRDVSAGDKIEFDRVLAVSDDNGLTIGKPTVSGAKVTAEVLGVKMGQKLVIQKFRRRKNSRRKTGHRQMHMSVRVEAISN